LGRNREKHLYGDEKCYVVLDINPVTEGHMLVITKSHYDNMLGVPKEELSSLFSIAQDFAKLAIEKLGAKGVNVGTNIGKSAGQEIMHVHVHVIPRYTSRYSKRHNLTADEEARLLKLLKKGSV
jgi:histidine triad (HIT) family protein